MKPFDTVLKAVLLIAALYFPAPVVAQDITQGRGPICDTADQLKKYAEIAHEPAAIETVNKQVGSDTACGVAFVAFVVGPSHGQVRNIHGAFTVTEITIVGVNLGGGWQPVRPFTQYTLFAVNEVES